MFIGKITFVYQLNKNNYLLNRFLNEGTKKSILGTFSSVKSCEHCNGSGRVPKTKCSNCRGAGIKKEQSEIKINVPAGINDGEMIRMSGEGEAIARGISGDLYVKIHISKHESLRKEGNNLVMNLNVKLTDALMGSDYNVDVLGEKIKLKIPAGVSFGEILRMKGTGVPVWRDRGRENAIE